jgi:nicotinamidase-related amidase
MINATKTALLLVDLQNAYFNNGELYERQDMLIKNANELIAIGYRNSMPVFNIRTEHLKDNATWTLNMLDDKEGYLFKGDGDSKNITGLHTQNTIEVLKTRDSAFYNTTLLSMLQNYHITSVIICGVSTHTCILQTAADAYAANIRVTLAHESIASHKPEFHDVSLKMLHMEYRQKLMTNSELENNIKNNRQQDT